MAWLHLTAPFYQISNSCNLLCIYSLSYFLLQPYTKIIITTPCYIWGYRGFDIRLKIAKVTAKPYGILDSWLLIQEYTFAEQSLYSRNFVKSCVCIVEWWLEHTSLHYGEYSPEEEDRAIEYIITQMNVQLQNVVCAWRSSRYYRGK